MLPLYLVALGALLISEGCREIPTSVNIGNGPSFTLRGNGQLASFRIYGPLPGRRIATPFDSKSLVWRIQPTDGYFKGAVVERLAIEYGRIPSGYKQVIPGNVAAPALPAGQVYYFFAETTNAPPASGFFYMEETTPIEIKVPGLCQSGFTGDVHPLKCGTSETYVEPTDLAAFAQENRLKR